MQTIIIKEQLIEKINLRIQELKIARETYIDLIHDYINHKDKIKGTDEYIEKNYKIIANIDMKISTFKEVINFI